MNRKAMIELYRSAAKCLRMVLRPVNGYDDTN